MQDNLQWVAHYNDGGTLHQIEQDGKKNAYQDIDRENLRMFMLQKEDQPVFILSFNGDGKDLIWRRRVQMRGGMQTLVHIVGKKHRMVSMVQDGLVMLFNNFDENDALLAEPEYSKEESGE